MTVAKNDQQKGRSLEEQLASLDALSNEPDASPAGEPSSAAAPAALPNGEPPVPPNPWLNRPQPADEPAAPAQDTGPGPRPPGPPRPPGAPPPLFRAAPRRSRPKASCRTAPRPPPRTYRASRPRNNPRR